MVAVLGVLSFFGVGIAIIVLLLSLIRKKPKKHILLTMGLCFVVFVACMAMPDNEENNDNLILNTENNTLISTIQTISTSSIEKNNEIATEKVIETQPSQENIIDIDYILLWNNYSDDLYKDKWVKIIGKVHKKSFMKAIYFNEGLGGGLTDNIDITKLGADGEVINISDNYSDGEYVSVIGLVTGKTFGTVYVKNSIIEKATDSDINKMNEYQELRNQIQAKIESDYINSANIIDYDSLIRRPDDYKGQIIKVTVNITQIFDSGGILGFFTEKGYAGTQNGNEWIIQYELPEGTSRIIENDIVTFYGEFDGVQERARAIGGSKVYIPHLIAEYHK